MKKPAKRKQRRALNKKTAFLKAFAICGDRTAAALIVGINRSIHYDWLKKDPKYPARFEAAKAQAEDALEDEATNRAMVGVYEPTVYQGRFSYPQEVYIITPGVEAVAGIDWKEPGGPVAAVPAVAEVRGIRNVPGAPPVGVFKKSDFLLGMRLRAAKPEYRANALEVTGANGGPIQVQSLAEVLRDRRAKREGESKP